MVKIPETLAYDLAKIWLSQQDLTCKTPQEIKEMFLNQVYKLDAANVERYD